MAQKLMNLNEVQSEMVLSFYEAAEHKECLPQAIANLSENLDGAAISLWAFSHVDSKLDQKIYYGHEDQDESCVYEISMITQCRLFRKMVNLKRSTVYYWNDVTSYDGLVSSALWQKCRSPHTTARMPLGQSVSYQLNTAYRDGFRNFEDSERRLWDHLILPHLWQALRLEHKIFGSDTGGNKGFDVLDQLSAAVVLLSDQGAVIATNQSAERILLQRDGINLNRKRLICSSKLDHREFSHLIAEAVQTGLGKVTGAGGFLSVSRPSLKRPYHVAIYPFLNGQSYSPGSKPARVLVLIDDPEERPEAPAHVLQRLYGISRAQSRVMILLLKGLKQEQIADELCLSKNTIKTHEREIFQHLDVRSRSELVRLVLPGLGSLQL